MDEATLIAELDRFIDGFELWIGESFGRSQDQAEGERTMQQWYGVVITICSRVVPPEIDGPMLIEDGRPVWWAIHQQAMLARGLLERGAAIREALGPLDNTALRAESMHPIVWDAARSFWRSEHYTAGVEAAAKAVSAFLQHKLGRRDVDNTKLAQEAFSLDAPTAGRPRLRVIEDDGSDRFKSLQSGALQFGSGCYLALRNPPAHGADIPETEALESLAAFSVLARWIDKSGVIADD